MSEPSYCNNIKFNNFVDSTISHSSEFYEALLGKVTFTSNCLKESNEIILTSLFQLTSVAAMLARSGVLSPTECIYTEHRLTSFVYTLAWVRVQRVNRLNTTLDERE